MQKCGSRWFFHLIYVEPKRQSDSRKPVSANDFRRCFFSSTFNIKMAIQKFTNFDKSFFKCMLI